MPQRIKKDRKVAKKEYFITMERLISTYSKFLIVNADNITSQQMQKLRFALRGEGVVLMGKNTMMRKIISDYLQIHHGHPIAQVLPFIRGNIGFVFLSETASFDHVRTLINENSVPTAARLGQISPIDVYVEPGVTGCDPGQTSWFQALSIATKINKGQIEIVNRVHLIPAGSKVTESQAALLKKLNLNPFQYVLKIEHVYDNGSVFSPAVLDYTNEKIAADFQETLAKVAAASLELGYPTQASVPHSIKNALAKMIAVCLEVDYSFPKAEGYKNFDPSSVVAAAPAASAEAAAPVVEEKVEEPVDMGTGGMFGDDW